MHVVPDPDPGAHDVAGAELACRGVYRLDPAALPLPPVVHVDRTYWDTETWFTRNTTTAQQRLGRPHHTPRPDGTKDIIAGFPTGPVRERDGVLALEAERALLGTTDGWLTPSLEAPHVTWTHTQAETDGGTGLALRVDGPLRRWDDPHTAPGLHVAVHVTTPGTYRSWLLVRFDSDDDDSCVLAVDGTPQAVAEQFCGGDMFSFGNARIWVWIELSELELTAGPHVLSVLARKSRLQVDRLYLTLGDERPPGDADWPDPGGVPPVD